MKRTIIATFLILTVFIQLKAADDLLYRSITMDDGLLSNTVRNIAQDKYGFVWFGTDNGLCRFDGTVVTPYRIAELGMNQYISALTVTEKGVFAGTTKGVFCILFNGRHDLIKLPMAVSTPVTSLSTDKDGNLWIATMGQGVWCVSGDVGQTEKLKVRHYDFKDTGGNVAQVMADNSNQIWTVTSRGRYPVQRLNRLHNRFEVADLKFDGSYHSFCMLQTRDDRLWLGSWNNGLLLMHSDGRLEQVINPLTDHVGQHIHAIFERHHRGVLSEAASPGYEICIGCDDGIICYNTKTGQWHSLLDNDDARAGNMSNRFVYAITSDTEGGLWIGTFYSGVAYVSPVSKRFEAFCANGDDRNMTGNVISRFCEDRRGLVWVASDDGGLMCFSPAENRFLDYPNRELLSECNVHALCIDSRNWLWIGTYSGGVYAMNLSNGQLRHYTQGSDANSLDSPNCYAICEDSQKRLWVATMNGLHRYNPEQDCFLRICQTDVLTIDIDEDKQGNLWLSTQGDGLWYYDTKTGKSRQYRNSEKDSTSIPNNEINCALTDKGDRLWVGTLGGLCYYDKEHDRFVRVHLDITSQNILSIIEDYGALWIATDRGIVKYVPDESVQQFTRQDGLSGEQAMANAILKNTDGRIFVGTTSGFSTFFPYRIRANSVMPRVYVTSIEIRNKQLTDSNGLSCDLSQATELELDYDEAQMVGFSFASLSYCSPKKNQYAYMLEGFDRDWNYIGNLSKATYTNLPAGTYTLRVKATNNDGLWSTDEARLRVVVHPPFWWSWYARLFYVLLACAGIWYYVHARLRRAERKHQREIDLLSEEKEKEVREARLNFFTMIAHEIRTPVSLIIGPLGKLMKEGQPSDDLRIIDRNAHRLLELVNQLLDFRKVEQQRLVMHFAPHDINDIVRSVGVRFEPTFSQGGKRFIIECDDRQLTAIVDREAITKVISNLLTNANKYTKDEVRLTCQTEPDEEHFRIVVADNGVGIRPEDQKRIFEPFFQAQDNKPGTGIGLNIVRNIVDQHHGTITVTSELGQGSTFVVTLPMKQPLADTPPLAETEMREDDTVQRPKEVVHEGAAAKLPLVLVVDDSEDMVAFLSSFLCQHYRVITAGDGIEALRQLTKHPVSLIISDWMMPRMDGAEFCRQVRLSPMTSHIPFLMLTAKTDDSSKVEGMDVGADAYIEKPFSVDYVEAVIRNILAMRQRLIEKFSTEPATPATDIASNQTDNEFMARMTKIIEENMSNSDLSVVFLAEQMGISRSGLFAKIKMMADVTPNEMIQIIRLKRAAQLLQTNKYTVSEIGYMVGFSNPSYFSKCFQKQFGIRPMDYMKQCTRPT